MLSVFIAIFAGTWCIAQTSAKEDDYKNAITQRVAKIILPLEIKDSVKYNRVLSIVKNQYFGLNDIHEETKKKLTGLKQQELPATEKEASIAKQQEQKSLQLKQLHEAFIAQIKSELTADQIELVKDGMTYRVFPITYAAYQDMLPSLTGAQKEQIFNWLKEARELAMDAESSDKKHEVFGKYKGKINNYLSAAGFNMKKEGEEWQKRIKERETAKKKTD